MSSTPPPPPPPPPPPQEERPHIKGAVRGVFRRGGGGRGEKKTPHSHHHIPLFFPPGGRGYLLFYRRGAQTWFFPERKGGARGPANQINWRLDPPLGPPPGFSPFFFAFVLVVGNGGGDNNFPPGKQVLPRGFAQPPIYPSKRGTKAGPPRGGRPLLKLGFPLFWDLGCPPTAAVFFFFFFFFFFWGGGGLHGFTSSFLSGALSPNPMTCPRKWRRADVALMTEGAPLSNRRLPRDAPDGVTMGCTGLGGVTTAKGCVSVCTGALTS
eukprot:FR744318.1.p1 GENE.FR744318.1~~FR744318.1.p1  ORF type:complete len:267 (-),score=84.70 FR744318.1:473-1273(-)